MGQAVARPIAQTCLTCQKAYDTHDKFCTYCGTPNPIYQEAIAFGVPSDRSEAERKTSLSPDAPRCAYCGEAYEVHTPRCRHCGGWLYAPDPAYTPRSRPLGLKRSLSTSRQTSPHDLDYHPMGEEALVTPTGKPTRKLVALSDAIFDMLCKSVPGPRKQCIDIPRLRFLEEKLGRKPDYMIGTHQAKAVMAIYQSLGLEFELIPFPPPAQHIETPCLTRKGFLQYLRHGILYDPSEAIRELRALLQTVPIAAPPTWLGSRTWKIEANMALAIPHQSAVDAQERMIDELTAAGHYTTTTRHGRRRSHTGALTPSSSYSPQPSTPPTPYLHPNYLNPYGYPSPTYAHPPYNYWPAYPAHPYSPGSQGGSPRLGGSPRRGGSPRLGGSPRQTGLDDLSARYTGDRPWRTPYTFDPNLPGNSRVRTERRRQSFSGENPYRDTSNLC